MSRTNPGRFAPFENILRQEARGPAELVGQIPGTVAAPDPDECFVPEIRQDDGVPEDNLAVQVPVVHRGRGQPEVRFARLQKADHVVRGHHGNVELGVGVPGPEEPQDARQGARGVDRQVHEAEVQAREVPNLPPPLVQLPQGVLHPVEEGAAESVEPQVPAVAVTWPEAATALKYSSWRSSMAPPKPFFSKH